jgi:hypothetical protein
MSLTKGFFANYEKIVTTIVKMHKAADLSDAVENAASWSGILINLFLKPLLEAVNEPDEKKFWETLVKEVATPAWETIPEEKRIKLSLDLDTRPPMEGAFTYPLLFPPVVWLKDNALALLADADQETKIAFCREFRERGLTTFRSAIWEKHFAAANAALRDDAREAYLGHLLEFGSLPLTEGEPPLKDIYVAERSCLMSHENWGAFDEAKADTSVDDTEAFILDRYFAAAEPIWSNDANNDPVLYVAADFGVGKTTFLKWFAASLAQRYLVGETDHYPIFMELGRHWKIDEIEANLKNRHHLAVDKDTPVIFLLDSIDESGSPDDGHLGAIIDEFAAIRKRYPHCRIVTTTRPLGGPNGKLAGHLRHRNLPFLHLAGFGEAEADAYIGKFRSLHGAKRIPNELTHGSIRTGYLTDPADAGKPLFLNMLLRLFAQGDITGAAEDAEGMSKTELYLLFMNKLSGRLRRKEEGGDQEKPKYRHIVRRLAAMRQILELPSMGGGKERIEGIVRADIAGKLDDADKELFATIDREHYLVLSHFGQRDGHLEFLHKSFREYLLAEYLLEQFVRQTDSFRLHVGYATTETLRFFSDLAALLARSLAGEEKAVDALAPILASICEGDTHFGYRLVADKTEFRDPTDAAEAIVAHARKVLTDENYYVETMGRSETVLGLTLHRRRHPPTDEHAYCEQWYAYLLLRAFADAKRAWDWEKMSAIPLGRLLSNSLHLTPFPRGAIPFSRIHLCDADLRGANLSGATLIGAYLMNADLTDADLRDAFLSGADLTDAYLSDADLASAYLSAADLTDANLRGAFLSDADLRDAFLSDADLRDAFLSGADLTDADLSEAIGLTAEQLETVPEMRGARLPETLAEEFRHRTHPAE